MRHKTTQVLYAYWNQLRGSRMAPRRFEIEPGGIGEILPDTFILERHDAGTFPYRLAGTRLTERFGREFRGQNFFDDWSAGDAASLRARLNTTSVQGGAALFLIEAESASRKAATLEMIVLPLIHMQAYADRFLGAVSVLDSPSWLANEPITACRLLADEVIWPDGRPHAVLEVTDRQAPFVPHVRRARIVRQDHRQFRVFDGGLSD